MTRPPGDTFTTLPDRDSTSHDTTSTTTGGTSAAGLPGEVEPGRNADGTPDEQRSRSRTTRSALAGPTTTTPAPLPPESCPNAKTCRRYVYTDPTTSPPTWPVVKGRASIPYLANPTACGLSGDTMRAALESASSVWEKAAPTIDFVFSGFTDRAPIPGDGYNVVGCTNASTAHAVAQGHNGVLYEADMLFAANASWRYVPCEQADNSCTPLPDDGTADFASIATHEFGHWLWLGDMGDRALDRELTMFPGDNMRSRHWRTLALGDVLGVRSLYPCSCPLPPIYTP